MQQRWGYYRVFVYGRRQARAEFVGRRLAEEKGSKRVFFSLYENQDTGLLLAIEPEEFPVRGYVEVRCLLCLCGKTREELIERFRELSKEYNVKLTVPDILDPPVVAVEDMHTMTDYDS